MLMANCSINMKLLPDVRERNVNKAIYEGSRTFNQGHKDFR